jgi:hypothetical protein
MSSAGKDGKQFFRLRRGRADLLLQTHNGLPGLLLEEPPFAFWEHATVIVGGR